MKVDKNSEIIILLILKHLLRKREASTSYQISRSFELIAKPRCFSGFSFSFYEVLDNLEKQEYINKVLIKKDNGVKRVAYKLTNTGMMLVNTNIQENLNV